MRIDAAIEAEYFNGDGFLPGPGEVFYMLLDLSLGSNDMWIGAPDAYTDTAMSTGKFVYLIDYVKVWYGD